MEDEHTGWDWGAVSMNGCPRERKSWGVDVTSRTREPRVGCAGTCVRHGGRGPGTSSYLGHESIVRT